MQLIILALLVLGLIVALAADTRQKRRKFILEENNHPLRN